jgi:hypothetical protein
MELFSINADDGDCCSCLVITCDGYARYWRTIVRPNDYYDVKLEFDQIELLCHFKVTKNKEFPFSNKPFLRMIFVFVVLILEGYIQFHVMHYVIK